MSIVMQIVEYCLGAYIGKSNDDDSPKRQVTSGFLKAVKSKKGGEPEEADFQTASSSEHLRDARSRESRDREEAEEGPVGEHHG